VSELLLLRVFSVVPPACVWNGFRAPFTPSCTSPSDSIFSLLVCVVCVQAWGKRAGVLFRRPWRVVDRLYPFCALTRKLLLPRVNICFRRSLALAVDSQFQPLLCLFKLPEWIRRVSRDSNLLLFSVSLDVHFCGFFSTDNDMKCGPVWFSS